MRRLTRSSSSTRVGEIPDYQMAALAMAIYLRGMDDAETAALTTAQLRSGDVLPNENKDRRVDKHSTGGIGDKSSLVVVPLLACCGMKVPMISGRGLGATGGTLDKLESIPGFRTNLEIGEILCIVDRLGCVITGATPRIVPADRKLYALRDVTGTVGSIPLIVASIMSKKLAEDLTSLVLDVKFGSGAFMRTIDSAEVLAKSMVATGARMGVRTTALLTDMNQPTGRLVGNSVEVDEAMSCLSGSGPPDLQCLSLALAAEILVMENAPGDRQQAETILRSHLDSGRAREKFDEMVAAQGGDPSAPGLAPPTASSPRNDRATFANLTPGHSECLSSIWAVGERCWGKGSIIPSVWKCSSASAIGSIAGNRSRDSSPAKATTNGRHGYLPPR